MTRRIVRTLVQLAAVAVLVILLVSQLDRSYRVLPKAIHSYLPSHHHGHVVTDLTVVTCSTLRPFSSCDAPDSSWQLVNRELYLGKAWTSRAFLYAKRKREEDLTPGDEVVVDVAVGNQPGSDGWEAREAGLWIRRSSERSSANSKLVVSDIDVVFGDDAAEARQGWAMVGRPLLLGTDSALHSVHLTVRRGEGPHEVRRPRPRVPDTGRLRIMQIGDMHLSTGVGRCREALPDSYKGAKCEADPRTLDFIAKMLDEEKPDLVILSGDQVNGDSAPDAPSAIYKYASLLIDRKIPWAGIFGNHDDEGTMSREAQMAIMESLPYSLSRAGPPDIAGVGNYYIEVLARGHSEHSALTIYLLDTHAYSPDEHKYPGYDWLKPDQIAWFRRTSAHLKAEHQGYTHRHMDMAFVHIPLTEYADWELPRLGAWREGVTAPVFNTGFRDALVEEGVAIVSAGHDHVNDYCSLSSIGDAKKDFKPGWDKKLPSAEEKTRQSNVRKTPALWMCYSGGAGFGGYAGYGGYTRRIRMFEVDTEEARITTWKRLENGDTEARIDEQIVVDGGKAYLTPEGR